MLSIGCKVRPIFWQNIILVISYVIILPFNLNKIDLTTPESYIDLTIPGSYKVHGSESPYWLSLYITQLLF